MNRAPGSALHNQFTLGDDDFVANFVARHEVLDALVRRLESVGPDDSGLHHILVGPRGMGKTSLLRRLAIAVNRDPDLAARYAPLSFREEQYNVLALGDFWRNCGEALAGLAEAQGRDDLAARLDAALQTQAWACDEGAAEQFEAAMATLERRAVLLVDNLDLILDALPPNDQWTLRRRLQARRGPILIGAATQPLKQSAQRDAAFYEFLQPHHLEPLAQRETELCMRALAERRGDAGRHVLQVLNAQPERLKTLHTLSGGNPRVLTLIYRLLESAESEAAMADLDMLLDQVTPYYKARIEEYQTPQQRAVIDAIALHWDPITTGDLSRATNIASTTLSPLLIKLRKDGLIENTEMSGAYAGHQMAERFLNIWYLMRHGARRAKQKMRWLVAFLSSFYSADDLTQIGQRAASDGVLTTWRADYRLAFEEALARNAPSTSRLATASAADPQNADPTRLEEDSALAQALALERVAFQFWEAGEFTKGVAVLDQIIDRLGEAEEPALREQVARALFNKGVVLGQMSDSAAEIAAYDNLIARFGDAEEPALREQVARAEIAIANHLLDTGDDRTGAEALYHSAAFARPLTAAANLAWLYLLDDRVEEALAARRSLDELPALGRALLDAGLALAQDNVGVATDHLATALGDGLDAGSMSFTDDLDRLLRLAERKVHGERLLAWFEATGFADRAAPLFIAFRAYVRGEKTLLDVNPEVRGPARIIYDRLDAPRRRRATPPGRTAPRRGRPRKA